MASKTALLLMLVISLTGINIYLLKHVCLHEKQLKYAPVHCAFVVCHLETNTFDLDVEAILIISGTRDTVALLCGSDGPRPDNMVAQCRGTDGCF